MALSFVVVSKGEWIEVNVYILYTPQSDNDLIMQFIAVSDSVWQAACDACFKICMALRYGAASGEFSFVARRHLTFTRCMYCTSETNWHHTFLLRP